LRQAAGFEPRGDQDRVGTGVQHDGVTPEALSHALRRTIALYARPDRWAMLQRNAMRADFSWDESGRRYANLYSSLLEPA
jgi:starch synthase